MYPGFTRHDLDESCAIWLGSLPAGLLPDGDAFAALWALRPDTYHRIFMGGRPVDTPRWQQAYGADYRYTGRVNRALPMPPGFQPYQSWVQALDPRLNALLVNWYDGALGHYIGRHRDDTRDMVPGTSIFTISLGEARTFRMRPWRAEGLVDVPIPGGSVLVIPWDTNGRWTHEVPRSKAATGRRISLTFRAFTRAQATAAPAP